VGRKEKSIQLFSSLYPKEDGKGIQKEAVTEMPRINLTGFLATKLNKSPRKKRKREPRGS